MNSIINIIEMIKTDQMAKNYLLIIVMIILSIAALMIASYYQYHYQ